MFCESFSSSSPDQLYSGNLVVGSVPIPSKYEPKNDSFLPNSLFSRKILSSSELNYLYINRKYLLHLPVLLACRDRKSRKVLSSV
jgi:hypothetical protein